MSKIMNLSFTNLDQIYVVFIILIIIIIIINIIIIIIIIIIMVVPLVIGALGGGIRQIVVDMGKLFESKDLLKRTICEMQKTVLMDSETTSRKVLSGLAQEMDE